MPDKTEIVRDRQRAIRREMIRRRISPDVVALDSQLSKSSVAGYFPNPDGKAPVTAITVPALFALLESGALPCELLSLLLPDGFAIVPKPDHIDHDDLMAACTEFSAVYGAARHPGGEAGIEIGPREAARLETAAGHVRAVVS